MAPVVGVPDMLGGLLLARSSAFHPATVKPQEPVGLNLLSDTINFHGTFTLGANGAFAIMSELHP